MRKRILSIGVLCAVIGCVLWLGFARQERNLLEASDNFYEKLADGFDVNILVVGDSISAGSGASDEDHRWVVMLEKYLEDTYHVNVLVNNVSLGGNTSYAGYVRTRNLQDGEIYDFAILCFAQNDSASELAPYYEALIRAVHKMCPSSSILSIKESTLRKEKHIPKVEAIETVSAYYGIPVADMVLAYQESGIAYEELSEDLIHPSDQGQQIYFETIRDMINSGVQDVLGERENAETDVVQTTAEQTQKEDTEASFLQYPVTVAEELPPLYAVSGCLDQFQYLPATSFYQEDSLHYITELDAFEGILGFDYVFDGNDHWAKLRIDGEEVMPVDLSSRGSTSMRYIWVLDESASLDGRIEIEFSDEEAASAFQGLVLSHKE